MIRDIESRSGAGIEVDQSPEHGYNTVSFRGSPDQKKLAYGLVVAEVMKAIGSTNEPPENFPVGAKDAFHIDLQYVGWVKGPQGKVVQDIQLRSGTRIDVDQTTKDKGYAVVRLFGMHDGIRDARRLIAAELSKVSPETAKVVSGDLPPLDPSTVGLSALSRSGPLPTASVPVAMDGSTDHVHIPNSCVGWLKGRQGAMLRDIESRSGAAIEFDQSAQENGYNLAYFRGTLEQKRLAHSLVVAEVMKAMNSTGEPPEIFPIGAKDEFRIDTQYVGWVKGPQGKVVQDVQVRSGTRVDVDQTNKELGYATVRIYGTSEGVVEAKRLIAAELSKISPETAATITSTISQSHPGTTLQHQPAPMMHLTQPVGLEQWQSVVQMVALQPVQPVPTMPVLQPIQSLQPMQPGAYVVPAWTG